MYEFNSLIDYLNEVLFNLFNFGHNKTLKSGVLINQVFYSGVQALFYVLFFSIVFSVIGNLLFFNFIHSGDLNIFGQFVVLFSFRDAGPLIISLILLLRSGTAITSEISALKCEKEISHILTLGISPISYLVAPRIIGLMVCSVVLSIYFAFFYGVFTACTTHFFYNIPFYETIALLYKHTNYLDIFLLFLKSSIGGFIISSVCCFRGLQCKESITEIPQQNIFAVRQSLTMIFVFHGLILFLEAINSGLLRYLKYA